MPAEGSPPLNYARGTGIDVALRTFGPWGPAWASSGSGPARWQPGGAGESWRYYELDPMVVEIAKRDFRYLDDSAAHNEIIVGVLR